jgi:hypothetical protein
MRDKIPIYFNYGSEDFLAPNIVDSIVEYKDLGFTVDSLVPRWRGSLHAPDLGPDDRLLVAPRALTLAAHPIQRCSPRAGERGVMVSHRGSWDISLGKRAESR